MSNSPGGSQCAFSLEKPEASFCNFTRQYLFLVGCFSLFLTPVLWNNVLCGTCTQCPFPPCTGSFQLRNSLWKPGNRNSWLPGVVFSLCGHGWGREGAWVPAFVPRVLSACGFSQKITQERKTPLHLFPDSSDRTSWLGNI